MDDRETKGSDVTEREAPKRLPWRERHTVRAGSGALIIVSAGLLMSLLVRLVLSVLG